MGANSGGQPGVDELDPSLVEVLGVAGGQGRVPATADGGDLGVEPVDRLPRLVPISDYGGVGRRCGGVEGQDLLRERTEYLVSGLSEVVLPASVGQPGDPIPDFG